MKRFLILATIVLAGCGSGGGSGGSGGSTAGALSGGAVRLVAVERQALSPAAAPALWLFGSVPAGVASSGVTVEESVDGAGYYAAPGAKALPAAAGAVHFELPMPGSTRYYRLTGAVQTNRVAVTPAASGPVAPAIASPAAGSTGVLPTSAISLAGGAGARSFLYAVAGADGTLVWLAESASASAAPGAPAGATFIGGALAPSAGHLAVVVALDDEGYGRAASTTPRVDFTTSP